jgi:hypothetical protein
MKWEYRVVTGGSRGWGKPEALEAEFNRLGAEGWEMVVGVAYGAQSQATAVVFKRPIS